MAAYKCASSICIGLSKVKQPTRHSIGHFWDDIFTGLMTKPSVPKH